MLTGLNFFGLLLCENLCRMPFQNGELCSYILAILALPSKRTSGGAAAYIIFITRAYLALVFAVCFFCSMYVITCASCVFADARYPPLRHALCDGSWSSQRLSKANLAMDTNPLLTKSHPWVLGSLDKVATKSKGRCVSMGLTLYLTGIKEKSRS